MTLNISKILTKYEYYKDNNNFFIYPDLKNTYNDKKIKVLTDFINDFYYIGIEEKDNLKNSELPHYEKRVENEFYKKIKEDIDKITKYIKLSKKLEENNVFKMHLFFILISNEYYIKEDIIYLILLANLIMGIEENSHAIMYEIDYKYKDFIDFFLRSSGLINNFTENKLLPSKMENFQMSNTYVKNIISIFINKLIIKNKRIEDEYIIFNFKSMEKEFEIKIPKEWKETSNEGISKEEHIERTNENMNSILITYNNVNYGYYNFLQHLIENNDFSEWQKFEFFYAEIINNELVKLPKSSQEGGKKKKIQVKNTKNTKIITGPRGGKYKILPNGKKYYMSK